MTPAGWSSFIRQLLTVGRVLWRLVVRQLGTEPFRTYALTRGGTLILGSLAGAVALRSFRPLLQPIVGSRAYVPVLGAAVATLGLSLLAVRLLLHRSLNVGSLRGALGRSFLSGASDRLIARSLPRTYLAVFLLLIAVPWMLPVPGVEAWLEAPYWGRAVALMAGTNVVAWWNLGDDSEAAAGTLLWTRPDRPIRFFERAYGPAGLAGWRTTVMLLELSDAEVGALFAPGPGPARWTARRLVAHTLSELTARLASVVPRDRLPALARVRLEALGGGSVLALARRAADPADPLDVADFYVRVGGLRARDLPVDASLAASGQA